MLNQIAHLGPIVKKKLHMPRKLSQAELEERLVLKNLNERGELFSSDSFDLINNIGLERKRAS